MIFNDLYIFLKYFLILVGFAKMGVQLEFGDGCSR